MQPFTLERVQAGPSKILMFNEVIPTSFPAGFRRLRTFPWPTASSLLPLRHNSRTCPGSAAANCGNTTPPAIISSPPSPLEFPKTLERVSTGPSTKCIFTVSAKGFWPSSVLALPSCASPRWLVLARRAGILPKTRQNTTRRTSNALQLFRRCLTLASKHHLTPN